MIKLNFGKVYKVLVSFVTAAILACSMLCIVSCAPSERNSQLKSPLLKTPDILENGKLKVGIDFDNPPLAGESVKASGIDFDVAAAIAEELGLKVEYVDINSSPEYYLAEKKVDIVMGITKSTNVEDMWRSDPYIQTACALFAKNPGTPLPTKEGSDKISTQKGSSSALALQSQFGSSNIKYESNISACLASLNRGDVKYVAGDAVICTYNAKTSNLSAELVGLLTKPSGFCIGADKENKGLIEKIQAALTNIKEGGVTDVIEKKWLGKALNLDNAPTTPEASNQFDAGELDEGVYSQTDPSAPKNPTNW